MWSDNETNIDFIDFQYYINAVRRIIDDPTLLPCSIGTFGDWGSGKSSLMKMISETYEGDKEILIIKFNGWLFEGYDDAKTVLMGSIVDEIIKKRKLTEKAKDTCAKLLKRIDLMKLGSTLIKYGTAYAFMGHEGISTVTSLDAMKSISKTDYSEYLKDDATKSNSNIRNTVQEFHSDFEKLISETKVKKVLVFIDDLDRCSPGTIIDTLEAIKLFLFAQNTVFIIGADERLIKYAVKRRFPELPNDDIEIGRDYLEKLIQYPVRIPFLSHLELEIYVNLLFSKLFLPEESFEKLRTKVFQKKAKDFNFVFNGENIKELTGNEPNADLQESLILSTQITPILTTGLNGNPRQCKRFLNTLILRCAMAKSRIQLSKKILAKLMLLEYFKPETFRLFYELQASNNGIIEGITNLENFNNTNGESENDETTKEDVIAPLQTCLQDEWIKDWLKLEPSLQEINLQPYFYFSRDRLSGSGSQNYQRMSPLARDIFVKLISSSEALRDSGINECNKISESDSTSIFEALVNKIKNEEDKNKNTINFKVLIEFCNVKKNQISQLLIFLDSLPEIMLTSNIIPLLKMLTEDSEFKNSLEKLFHKWKNSESNSSISKILKEKDKGK